MPSVINRMIYAVEIRQRDFARRVMAFGTKVLPEASALSGESAHMWNSLAKEAAGHSPNINDSDKSQRCRRLSHEKALTYVLGCLEPKSNKVSPY